ncbi:MAG: hypothetical protein R2939_03080 [Kofleriaceae bacterium]
MRLQRTVLLRADGGPIRGVCHLARTAGLADALTAAGHQPVLLLGGDLATVRAWCASHDVAATVGAWDASEVRALAAVTAASAVVLDGPRLVRQLGSALLGDANPDTIVLDDAGGVELPVAAIVNPAVGADALAATYPGAQRRLLGRRYEILRREVLRHGQGACACRGRAPGTGSCSRSTTAARPARPRGCWRRYPRGLGSR